MKRSYAFSLVELAIVLAILGLLTGAIVAGKSLIRSAELQSVSTELERYHSAIAAFQTKYLALPGDMSDATDIWGTDPNGCPTHSTYIPKRETCNGNGNGIMGDGQVSAERPERFRFWQQLANAGLIEGTYTGVAGPDGWRDVVAGENSPKSSMSEATWSALYIDNDPSFWSVAYTLDYGNHLVLGADVSGNNGIGNPVFTPKELWSIDKKTDDALPGRGKIMAGTFADCTTASGATDLDAPYNRANLETVCYLRAVGGY